MADICRSCLQEISYQNYFCLFSNQLYMIFEDLTSLKVLSNDTITTKLCRICKEHLESFDQFKKKCIQSNTILRLKNDIKEENDILQKKNDNIAAEDEPTINKRPLNKGGGDDFIKFENININEMDTDAESVEDDNLIEQRKKTRFDRKKHVRTEEDKIEESESEEEEREFILENGLKKYICRICKKKKFILLGPLKKHEKKHSQKKLIICDLCGAVLSCAKALKSHMKYKHSEERPFPCGLCILSFKSNGGLKEHISVCHIKERKFICDICSSSSKSLKTLRRHIKRVHFTEKTHPCSHCDVKFKDKKTLAQHLLIHSDIRPFVCDICSRGFAQISSLHKHIKICGKMGKIRNPSIKCDDCIKMLASKKTLVNHRLKCHKLIYRSWGCASKGLRYAEKEKIVHINDLNLNVVNLDTNESKS